MNHHSDGARDDSPCHPQNHENIALHAMSQGHRLPVLGLVLCHFTRPTPFNRCSKFLTT